MDELKRLIEMAGIDEDNSNKAGDAIDKGEYVLKKHGNILTSDEWDTIEAYLAWLRKGDGYIRPVGGISAGVPEQSTIDTAKIIIKYHSRV